MKKWRCIFCIAKNIFQWIGRRIFHWRYWICWCFLIPLLIIKFVSWISNVYIWVCPKIRCIYNIYYICICIYTPKTVVKHHHHHKLKHCHFRAWSIFDTTICLCCLPNITYQSKWTTLMVSTWVMSERHFVEESPDMVIKKKRTTMFWTCEIFTLKQ